jgi:hypothetical protein
MKQACWGFLAGMVVMAALIVCDLSLLPPRQPDGAAGYKVGTVSDMRDC